MTFSEIFDVLLVPRENGSAALGETARWLYETGRAFGAHVELQPFLCRPYVHRAAGWGALVCGLATLAAASRKRFGWSFLLALLLPLYLFLEVEAGLGPSALLGTVEQENVVLRYEAPEPKQKVVLGAHYDTKTDLFDHAARAPVQFLLVPACVLALLVAASGWRRVRKGLSVRGPLALSVLVAAYDVALFLVLSGGSFVARRSPGALDDGSSVALLLRLAEKLGRGEIPLERTSVDIVFFSGEEVGLQGSKAYVERLREPLPFVFVNAEALGAGPRLRFFTSDRSALRRYDAWMPLARKLDTAARRALGRPLEPDALPVTTDTRSFLEAGVPAVTISSYDADRWLRGLHSARDDRERIQLASLERTLRFYEEALRVLDDTTFAAWAHRSNKSSRCHPL